MGFRYAICNETWGDLSFEETCRRIAAAGYDGVEIAPFTLAREFGRTADLLTPQERAHLRQTAEDVGLSIVGLHWLLVPPPDGLHLTTADREVREKTANYLAALTDLCADLGGSILVLGSPKQRNLPNDADDAARGAARIHLIDVLLPCLSRCLARGVTLCLEPLSPAETNFLNTLAEVREVITAADQLACRTIFDVKAASSEGTRLPDLIAMNGDIIAHVHANDANRRGPGFGDTDFVPILHALKSIEYDGWVSVEVFDYSPDPDTIATKSLATLRAAEQETGGAA